MVWVLESVFEYAYQVLWRNLAQTIQHEARLDAYAHVQGLEMAYFEDRSTGGLLAVLNDDVNQLERFLDRGANDILQVLTTVVLVGAAFFVRIPTSPRWRSCPSQSSYGARCSSNAAWSRATPTCANASGS